MQKLKQTIIFYLMNLYMHTKNAFTFLINSLSFPFFNSLINKIKPGIIKKINRLSTPIAGLVGSKIMFWH